MPDAGATLEISVAKSGSRNLEQATTKWGREGILTKFIVIAVLGLLIIILYSLQFGYPAFVSVVSVGIMIAGGSLLVGSLLGFMFGIPRTPQELIPSEQVPSREEENSVDNRLKMLYKPNSNLEQISDWLTKILVGVGLTQISQIRNQVYLIAISLKPSLGNADSSGPFAIAIVIYFLICGFLVGYLWTRFFMARELTSSDVAVRDAIKEVQVRVDEVQNRVESQSERDAEVLRLVDRQLNLVGNPEVSQQELNEAIERASSAVIGTIFNQAHTIRSQNWQKNKHLMERTIAIFRALVARDRAESFHRYHGQLGYALKDKQQPEWAAAKAELDKAIEIRDGLEERGWLHYEFNRALCKINQDKAFVEGMQSAPETRNEILGDLRAAAHYMELKEKILNDKDITKWMKQNKITAQDLP